MWLLILLGIAVVGTAAAVLIARARESSEAKWIEASLLESGSRPGGDEKVDFGAFIELPLPVERYFRHVMTDGQGLIRIARSRQTGTLRTNTKKDDWNSFTAIHLAVPPAAGFVWNARVEMPLGIHMRVLDSFAAGIGSGRVSLLSAFPVASETGTLELNSGALHRYLAESVWYPTALLPQSGVVWSPIDDESALATVTSGGTAVSLEFRFNDVGEVTAIYTPGRFGRFDGAYKQVPWEGHFRNYRERRGMHIPGYGEVGWYENDTLQLVWKGDVTDVEYEFDR